MDLEKQQHGELFIFLKKGSNLKQNKLNVQDLYEGNDILLRYINKELDKWR